jgi:hypothetical protein
VNFDDLVGRAADQRAQVEAQREQAARAALRT